MTPALALIISHEPLVRLGLRTFLEKEAWAVTVCEAGTGVEALEMQRLHGPAIVLLCACAAEVEAVRLVQDLCRRRREQPLLVISRAVVPEHVRRCLEAGALGYVSSHDGLEELRRACTAVLDGDLHVSRYAARGLHVRRVPAAAGLGLKGQGVEALSLREQEVFSLMGGGLSTGAVAQRLSLSVKTIETHQQRMKEKLGLKLAAELKRAAVEHQQSLKGRA